MATSLRTLLQVFRLLPEVGFILQEPPNLTKLTNKMIYFRSYTVISDSIGQCFDRNKKDVNNIIYNKLDAHIQLPKMHRFLSRSL